MILFDWFLAFFT